MNPIRVVVVDDSLLIRGMIISAINDEPDMMVVGTAGDGAKAIREIERVGPDVVTLDVIMPVVDGLRALKRIREKTPALPVIMFSGLTEEGAKATIEALTLGATDCVAKPSGVDDIEESIQVIREKLIPRIRQYAQQDVQEPAPVAPQGDVPPARIVLRPRRLRVPLSEVVCIGCSTGGPQALSQVLSTLRHDFRVPILVVQHMPAPFTRYLAERLDQTSPLWVVEAADGMVLRPGQVCIAPGGHHVEVARTSNGVCIQTHKGPPELSCRPSLNVLLRSVASVYGDRSTTAVLTGMGHDGLEGCRMLAEAGARILVQDEDTSVVWGMPGAVAGAGIADRVIHLSRLARELIKSVYRRMPSDTIVDGGDT